MGRRRFPKNIPNRLVPSPFYLSQGSHLCREQLEGSQTNRKRLKDGLSCASAYSQTEASWTPSFQWR